MDQLDLLAGPGRWDCGVAFPGGQPCDRKHPERGFLRLFPPHAYFLCQLSPLCRLGGPRHERKVHGASAASGYGGGGSKRLNDKQLAKAIDSWIEKKGFLDNTKSVKEIAQEMGFYYPAIKNYIQATTGEDFRSWRTRLRVQEAMRLMAEKPDILISDLVFITGFNDRAFFYRCFQKVTGKTIREYRDSLRNTP